MQVQAPAKSGLLGALSSALSGLFGGGKGKGAANKGSEAQLRVQSESAMPAAIAIPRAEIGKDVLDRATAAVKGDIKINSATDAGTRNALPPSPKAAGGGRGMGGSKPNSPRSQSGRSFTPREGGNEAQM